MNEAMKKRVAWALKCRPEDVPEQPEQIRAALDKRRAELRAAKAVRHG